MKNKIYNKLVRDKIPEIIKKNGSSCEVRKLSDNEYIEMLDAKLIEEVKEYQESQDIEEIADILEVLMAITKSRGYKLPS